MVTLILVILVAILSALFATQNTDTASLTLASYTFKNIPMYLIILGSVLIGLVLSSILSIVNGLASSLTMHGKDVKIKETKATVTELTKKNHQLELENARLQTEFGKTPDEKSL